MNTRMKAPETLPQQAALTISSPSKFLRRPRPSPSPRLYGCTHSVTGERVEVFLEPQHPACLHGPWGRALGPPHCRA